MTGMSYLEDFAAKTDQTAFTQATTSASPKSYDEGYEAGWNDAIAAEKDASDKSLRDMAVALQEAGFTYFEARQHVLKSLRPFVEAISQVILPELAQASLGPKIVETLDALANGIEDPIEILCPPAAESTLREICEEQIKFPVTLQAEPTLADQQVLFRYANGSAELDMSRCVADIQTAITEFYAGLTAEDIQHA